jgi:AraC-like DNA-binding protein
MPQNRNIYENCFCHRDGEYPVVEYVEFPDAETGTVHRFHHEMVFVVRGSIHAMTDIDPVGRTMEEWEFVFVPMGVSFSYRAAAGSAMVIARLTGVEPECQVFRINKAQGTPEKKERDDRIYTLRACERMRYDIESLIAILGDGPMCRNFLQIEVSRLLYLIQAYHSREEVSRFFASVVSSDLEFSEFVQSNWVRYQSADSMAGAMDIHAKKFTRRFKSVFGVPFRQWLSRQKARAVYRDICSSGKPLRDVARTYGFTDRSNFHRYCVHNYGSSPADIRRRLTAGPPKVPDKTPEYAMN